MKLEIGLVVMAFFGGMVVQDSMSADEVEWADYGENPMLNPQFMQDFMAAGTPGAEHKALVSTAGEYTVDQKMWMAPGMDAEEATASAKRESVLGGRYLIEYYESSFGGMPFEGMLIQGYDNMAEEHFTIWMDSFSTWPSLSRGEMGEDGKLTLGGIVRDVTTPKGRPMRTEVTTSGDGKSVSTMYDTSKQGEFKMMELVYTKKK